MLDDLRREQERKTGLLYNLSYIMLAIAVFVYSELTMKGWVNNWSKESHIRNSKMTALDGSTVQTNSALVNDSLEYLLTLSPIETMVVKSLMFRVPGVGQESCGVETDSVMVYHVASIAHLRPDLVKVNLKVPNAYVAITPDGSTFTHSMLNGTSVTAPVCNHRRRERSLDEEHPLSECSLKAAHRRRLQDDFPYTTVFADNAEEDWGSSVGFGSWTGVLNTDVLHAALVDTVAVVQSAENNQLRLTALKEHAEARQAQLAASPSVTWGQTLSGVSAACCTV